MIDYLQLFLYIIYFQQFIWIIILNYENKLLNNKIYKLLNNKIFKLLFYSLSLLFILSVIVLGIGFDVFTPYYFVLYSSLVLYSVYKLNIKFDFKTSLCLGFLLVWINSYYWEFALHFSAFIQYGLSKNGIQQGLHLLPVPMLLMSFKFQYVKEKIIRLLYGLIYSFFTIFIIDYLDLNNYVLIFYLINRFICLYILVSIFLESEKK